MNIFEINFSSDFDHYFLRLLFPNITLHLTPVFTSDKFIFTICPLNQELYPNCETLIIKKENGILIDRVSGFFEFLKKVNYMTETNIEKQKKIYFFLEDKIPFDEIPIIYKEACILKIVDFIIPQRRTDMITLVKGIKDCGLRKTEKAIEDYNTQFCKDDLVTLDIGNRDDENYHFNRIRISLYDGLSFLFDPEKYCSDNDCNIYLGMGLKDSGSIYIIVKYLWGNIYSFTYLNSLEEEILWDVKDEKQKNKIISNYRLIDKNIFYLWLEDQREYINIKNFGGFHI